MTVHSSANRRQTPAYRTRFLRARWPRNCRPLPKRGTMAPVAVAAVMLLVAVVSVAAVPEYLLRSTAPQRLCSCETEVQSQINRGESPPKNKYRAPKKKKKKKKKKK